MRIKQPRAARKSLATLDDDAMSEPAKGFGRGNIFHLSPVFAFVGMSGMKQRFVESGFVTEEEETFGVGIESADGIEVFGEKEFREIAVGRAVRGELGDDAVRFVKSNQHSLPGD